VRGGSAFLFKRHTITHTQDCVPRLAVAVGCPAACATSFGVNQNRRTPAGLPTTRFSGTIAQARINTPCSQRLVVVGDAYRRNARVGLLFSETPYEQQLAASVPRAPSLARFAPGADRAAASCRRRRSRAVDSVPLPAPKQPRSSHPRCGLWFSKRRLR
jgi:hypothetical protein